MKNDNCTLVLVVGVPGAGKSSILKALVEETSNVEVINYGKAMLEAAGFEEGERDKMRHLPFHEQRDLGREAAKLITEKAKQRKDTIFVVDTHILVQSPHGYVPGLPQAILEILQPRALSVVEAEPDFILQCRNQDSGRARDPANAQEIASYQKLNRQFAVSCSAITGCLLQFITNDGKPPAEVVKPLVEMINSLGN